jgi:hypothetical protein
MAYKLLPSQDDDRLFSRMDGEDAWRHGAIGYMRADFGKSGGEFWTTWFDTQVRLKTHGFEHEFKELLDSLRDDTQKPPFTNRGSPDGILCR